MLRILESFKNEFLKESLKSIIPFMVIVLSYNNCKEINQQFFLFTHTSCKKLTGFCVVATPGTLFKLCSGHYYRLRESGRRSSCVEKLLLLQSDLLWEVCMLN